MKTIADDTLIFNLTVGELKRIVAETTAVQMQEIMKAAPMSVESKEPQWVKGLDGLAGAMCVSKYTICKWKKEGLLDGMYMQTGKVINFDLGTIRKKLGREFQRRQN